MKRCLFAFFYFAILILLNSDVLASHMVGGGFSYAYVSNNRYHIQLDYYKDCSANSVDYPPGQIRIGIYRKSDNTLVQTLDLFPGPIINVKIIAPECATTPITCVQKRIYSDTLFLNSSIFNDSTGYYLNYEQCCRNFGIKNIVDPDNSGIAYYADFNPYTNALTNFRNSSPVLNTEQNVYLCVSEPFIADYSHSDPDGDSLVYRLIDPLMGTTDNVFNNASGISINNPKPYPPITWRTGYGFLNNNIMDGNPDLKIDSSTGQLTITPKQFGTYSFAYAVEEYREGELLAKYNKEVQYQIIMCDSRNAPEIQLLNPSDTILKADSTTCFYFEANDINNQDTLSVFIENLSTVIDQNSFELSIDSSVSNKIKFTVCVNLNCDAISSLHERFRVIVKDNSCPSNLYDTLLLDLSIREKINHKPSLYWVNSSENVFKANTTNCIEIIASDSDALDSLTLSILNLTPLLQELKYQINIDSSIANNVKANICFETICYLPASTSEGFWVKVQDNLCPETKSDSLWLTITTQESGNIDPLKDIPNVFSPNGDGKNDFFKLSNQIPSNCVDDFSLSVYNRWGELVYETKNYAFEWSGDGLPYGVYFYVVKLADRQKIGHLSIMY